jgi:hypothetical protein
MGNDAAACSGVAMKSSIGWVLLLDKCPIQHNIVDLSGIMQPQRKRK